MNHHHHIFSVGFLCGTPSHTTYSTLKSKRAIPTITKCPFTIIAGQNVYYRNENYDGTYVGYGGVSAGVECSDLFITHPLTGQLEATWKPSSEESPVWTS